MSERKVINKYYPKDYDHTKLKRDRSKKGKNVQTKVRMALPMSVQCVSCGNFMARGSKFNARKETVLGEEYMGLMVLRFYFRCSKCFQELTIKTDPKNSDYVTEHGIKANFILHKAAAAEDALENDEKEKLELFDKMKLLEQKSIASLAETEINDAIDTVLMLQSRRSLLSTEELHSRALHAISSSPNIIESEEELTEEELAELIEMEEAMAQKHAKSLQIAFSLSPFSHPPSSSSSPSLASSTSPSSLPLTHSLSQSSIEDEEDEDPIAARSRLARERIEAQRQSEWQETSKETEKGSSSPSSTPKEPNSTSSPQSTLSSASDASKSMPPPKSTSFLKPGWTVKPVKDKVATSSETSSSQPSTSVASVTTTINQSEPSLVPNSANKSLLGKKYARRDEDD